MECIKEKKIKGFSSKKSGNWKKTLKIFFKHKIGVIGFIGVMIVFMVAILAPYIAEPAEGYGNAEDILLSPSPQHIFGTDSMGLDIFSEVVWGARSSIKVGFIAVIVSIFIGVPIGLVSGYFKGPISTVAMGITDIFLTIPVLPLMIIIAAVVGNGINKVAVVIGLFSWPSLARITKAATLEVSNMQYIEAAKSLGIRTRRILIKHVLVNASAPILVNLTLIIATLILTESGLSFLGLGDPITWSWGRILQNAHRSGAFVSAWWFSLFPSLAIMFFVISFNFLGMGIREALNPKLRER